MGCRTAACSHFWPFAHKYGYNVLWKMNRAMKATIEVADALSRRAKSEAALRGRKVKDLSRKDCGLYSRLHADRRGSKVSPN